MHCHMSHSDCSTTFRIWELEREHGRPPFVSLHVIMQILYYIRLLLWHDRIKISSIIYGFQKIAPVECFGEIHSFTYPS
jgi:hypothetical protein